MCVHRDARRWACGSVELLFPPVLCFSWGRKASRWLRTVLVFLLLIAHGTGTADDRRISRGAADMNIAAAAGVPTANVGRGIMGMESGMMDIDP